MDLKDIEPLLSNYTNSQANRWVMGWDFWWDATLNEWHVLDVGLDARTVYSNGDTDYEGSDIEVVVEVDGLSVSPRYFRKSGYLSSYTGIEWDGVLQEVYPHPVTSVVYKTRK